MAGRVFEAVGVVVKGRRWGWELTRQSDLAGEAVGFEAALVTAFEVVDDEAFDEFPTDA